MDKRRQDVVALLGHVPFQSSDRVLDMGMGDGQIAEAVVRRVKRVVGTGLRFSSYGLDALKLRQANILAVECLGDLLPFPEGSFDAVIMSHILEHMPNVGAALAEIRRVLATSGWLCLFVPPAEGAVLGGHVSVGWNLGQLMYVLALNGFDTAHGHYAQLGYNVCAFVKKDFRPLPPLRHDFGDLRTLADDGRFPIPLKRRANGREVFQGQLEALNWPWTQVFPTHRYSLAGRALRKLIPSQLRRSLARFLARGAGALTEDFVRPTDSINPSELTE